MEMHGAGTRTRTGLECADKLESGRTGSVDHGKDKSDRDGVGRR